MIGKVLHNVYQVRVGQQLYPTTIGRKYIFPPADISMQYFEQRKAIVNTCQLCDDHFDRDLVCFDGSALKLMSENDESETSTHTSLDTYEKPKSSPPVLSRPLSAKLSNLAARSQPSRKSKSTNWYLHHVPPSIQKNTKCPNEKTRNISILNDFANRSYLNRDLKPIKQRSQLCAALSQVRKPNVNSMKRPNTVPNAREGKFAKYTKPSIGPLNAKPCTNFSFHTQCHSMSVRPCKEENATLKNYAEYFRKRKLGSKYKLFPDEFSINTSVRNFKDSSSHKLKEPDLNENSSKQGKSDIPFSTTKLCDSSRPTTPSRHQNCRVIHFNTHALKSQESKLQQDRSGEKINKEESLDEPAAKIQRNIDVPAASKVSKTTNGKSSSKLSAAQSHNIKPKKVGIDDSRPTSKQKSSITTTERPVSRAKSVLQTKVSSSLTRRSQTPVDKKQAISGIPLHSGRQRNTLYELQNKVRKEKRESKKQKYFPPLGASHSFGRPITTRPATSPGRFRDASRKGTDQFKVKRKLDESYARTLMEEMKIKRPKTAGGRETEKYAYSKVDRFRHPRPRLMKSKFEESLERGRDTFRHDDRKYHSDEAEIQRMKRQMFVNSISNGMKPKSAPKLKAKNSGTTEGLNERKEMLNATERDIPILHADTKTESRKETLNSVFGNAFDDISMEAAETKDSKEKRTIKHIVQVQTIESAMEVDTRKRSMTSNIMPNKETEKDEDEENESTKPKKPLNSSIPEVLTTQTLYTQPLSRIKLDKSTSLDQRIAETFEAMRLAQNGICKTESLTDPLEKGRQTSKTKHKNLYSLPNERENSDRKLTPRQMSQGDIQDAKEPETDVKPQYKKYLLDSRLSDWLKDVRNSELRDKRRHSFIRERNKQLDFTKNIEASSKQLDKRREENSNKVKMMDDNMQHSSFKRKRKEPFDHRQISRSQKSKVGRYSEEIGTVRADERLKLSDSAFHRRTSKYTSPERRKSKNRRRHDHNGSSQTSQDSFDRKSHSQQNMKCATDFLDVVEKRKVKSSVAIGEKKLKDKKRTSLSFHNLGRKPLERYAKKYPVTRSIRSRSEIDLKGKSVFEQWRARLRRLKNSFFGSKD